MSEKEYIERNAIIAEYDRVHIGPPGGARKLMVDAPTADVVEVVRRKNCKNFCEYGDSYKSEVEGADGDCFIRCLYSDNEQFIGVKCDDFCSYGERRTDDESKCR